MEKRKIGSLKVSAVGMGCMGFSHGYGVIPDHEYSLQAIRRAFEAGCTFFDTAESYGTEQFYPGHNEELVGEALQDLRDQVVLATKLHFRQEDEERLKNGESLYQVMSDHLSRSLKRLRTDYVDLYYLHRVNPNIPVEEVAEVMGKFQEEGLIREWGMSQVGIDTIARAHAVTPVAAVQNLYSMVERGVEKELMGWLLEHDIALVPFSPIASGLLSGKINVHTEFEAVDDVRKFVPQLKKENIAGNQPIVDLLQEFAQAKHASPAQISLAWMLKKYPNVIPIPGSKNQERILENLGGGEVVLRDEEFAELEKRLNACKVYGHRGFEEDEKNSFGNNWKKK